MNQEDYRLGISNILIIRRLVRNTEKKLFIVDKNGLITLTLEFSQNLLTFETLRKLPLRF